LKPVLASLGGLGASLLLRPDGDHYVSTAWTLTTLSMGWLPGGRLPQSGGELAPPAPGAWVVAALGPGIALLVALGLGRGKPRVGSASARAATLLAVGATALLSLRVARFGDYFLPVLALAAATWWPASLILDLGRRVRAGLAGAVLARVVWVGLRGWAFDVALFPPPESLGLLAREVRSRVPPGSLIFVDDWGWAGVLYGFLPEYRYPLAYDPATLYAASPERFWIWEHASADGAYCPHRDLAECPAADPGPAGVALAMQAFGAEWVVTRGYKGPHDLRQVVDHAPDWFEAVAQAAAAQSTFTLWHLKRSP
jgi:hypothetical protein